MTKKKTTTKHTPTLKEKLIEEAQKLIGIAEIKPNALYYFVKRDDKLTLIECLGKLPTDTVILQIRGTKIRKGLEEYQWDCYGDTLVHHFTPKEITCTDGSIDESATMAAQTELALNSKARKPLTVEFYIEKAKQLMKKITIKAGTNYYYVERDGILQLVPDVECQETDKMIFCVIGKITQKGYDEAQWLDIGKILRKHFSKR